MIIEHYIDLFTTNVKKLIESAEKMQKGAWQAFEQFLKLLTWDFEQKKKQ